MTLPLPVTINQVPWLGVCLREIECRSYKLSSWEWWFIGEIRKDVYFGRKIDDKRQERLSSIRNLVFSRTERPKEKEWKPKDKVKSWIQD